MKQSQEEVEGMEKRPREAQVEALAEPEVAAAGSERRYTKLEEAMEVKSLRRIISAYLKYSEPSSSSRLIACGERMIYSSLEFRRPCCSAQYTLKIKMNEKKKRV